MIVNKYANGNGGGGGTGSTITVDAALSSSSTNPVENRVITNALDDYATKEEITGTTIETPVVLSNTESSVMATIYNAEWAGSEIYNLRNTNIDNLVGIRLSDYYSTSDQPYIMIPAFTIGNDTYGLTEPMTATSETYVVLEPLTSWANTYSIIPSALDGTYDYTLLYNTSNNSIGIFKNPTVGEDVPGVLDDYWTTGETQNAIQEAIEGAVTGATITVDDALSTASTNPVENRVITTALSEYTTNEYVEHRFDETEAYTDSQINNLEEQMNEAISAATEGLASEDYVDNAVTSATEGLASEGYVDAAITAATENLATEQYVNDAVSSASTEIYEYVDAAILTGATITVDDALSTASTNPVENRVIANKFGDYYTKAETDAEITAATQNYVTSGDVTTAITSATQNFITSGDVQTIVDDAVATAITIDSALSTGSTNPVQNQAITNALGNYATEQHMLSYLDGYYGDEQLRVIPGEIALSIYEVVINDNAGTQFLRTTSPDYVAIDLSEVDQGASSLGFSQVTSPTGDVSHIVNVDTDMTTADLGVAKNLISGTGTDEWIFRPENFDGTYNYYLLLNVVSNTIQVVKNLPVLEDVQVGSFIRYPDFDGEPGDVLTIDDYGNPSWYSGFVTGSGVKNIVKCTQAEYDAMQSHDQNTFYIITNS